MNPAPRLICAVLALALLTGCEHDGEAAQPFPSKVELPMPITPSGLLAVEEGLEITQLAAGGGYVVWTTKFEDVARADVRQIELETGRLATLAAGEIALHGLASTRDWVVYALHPGSPVLLARSHDGVRRHVLSWKIIGSLGSRGDLVAWAEEHQGIHRIVVREMSTGREWLARSVPRCEREMCFRIEAVSLSDEGVSFIRGAIGAHPSQVWRRSFSAEDSESFHVPDDPQPDLIPSSPAPAFMTLGGRVRTWSFGTRAPRDADVPTSPAESAVLGHERGWWFVSAAEDRTSAVYARREDGSERLLTQQPSAENDIEAVLEAFAWSGRQAFSAWALYERGNGEIEASVIEANQSLPGVDEG